MEDGEQRPRTEGGGRGEKDKEGLSVTADRLANTNFPAGVFDGDDSGHNSMNSPTLTPTSRMIARTVPFRMFLP